MRNAVIKVGLLLGAYIIIATPTVSALDTKHFAITEKPFNYESSLLISAEEDSVTKPKNETKQEKKVEKKPVEAPVPPPVITYVVAESDNLTKIAELHSTTVERLYAKNLNIANPDVLNIAQVVTIPSATEQLPERPLPVLAIVATQPLTSNSGRTNSTNVSGAVPRGGSAGNTYTAGYCTWYAKSRRPDLPNNLGNANTWTARAASQGLATGSVPQVGAIGQQGMHVVYVEAVNGDGTITISEMNYRGLYVTSSRTAPASSFSYIY